jgi:hypothetical protein
LNPIGTEILFGEQSAMDGKEKRVYHPLIPDTYLYGQQDKSKSQESSKGFFKADVEEDRATHPPGIAGHHVQLQTFPFTMGLHRIKSVETWLGQNACHESHLQPSRLSHTPQGLASPS